MTALTGAGGTADRGGDGNRLLGSMEARDRDLLLVHATRTTLTFGEETTAPDQPIPAALFPENGVLSVVKPGGPGERIELCLIGREGFAGAALVTADGRWPYRTFVQVPEMTALRVDADDLARCLERSPSLRLVLIRAVHAMFIQVAEGLISAAWQKLDARLARWLVMYRDRIETDRIEVTHDFLASMVAAQRTGVTHALHEMEGAGLIRAARGAIIVRDLAGLQALADDGYGVAEREARRILPARADRPAPALADAEG